MTRMIAVAILGLLPFQVRVAAAEPPSAKSAAPTEGLWPSTKLMTLLTARWADDMAAEFEFDEEQHERLRESATTRWPKFFNDNRSQIQPLINEFVEMRFEPTPPSNERVQTWSKNALPVFEKLQGQLQEGANDLRELLSPIQKAEFEFKMAQFGVGLKMAQTKLQSWADGDFSDSDEYMFWEPTGKERRRRNEERRAAREARRRDAEGPPADGALAEAAPPQPVDQITEELHAWDKHVDRFVRLHELDEGQVGTARSVLKELKARATAHRDRNIRQIAKLEQRIASSDGSKEELADIKKQLLELYGPIDTMFQELQARLKQIPTAEQRARVDESEGKG